MTPSNDRHQLLREFLRTWPLERVETMTLEEYVVGASNSKDSFCYWLETYAKQLGNIKGFSGGGSFKFGIFCKNPKNAYDSSQYTSDEVYAWKRTLGANRNVAFDRIKSSILAVIKYSGCGEFDKIEEVTDLFSFVKWKIAFIYSNYGLVPIYKSDWLRTIAIEQGFAGNIKLTSELQVFILQQKPLEADFFEWYDELLNTHIKSQRSYFVIGSNYHDPESKEWHSKLEEFYRKSVVATDFLWEHSLKSVFGMPIQMLDPAVRALKPEKNKLQALRKFLTIREGDIIAVKAFGVPNQLNIAAYAVACADEQGELYHHDPEGLGHCINVNYIETDVDLNLKLTKTHSVHRIKDQYEIDMIFKAYQDRGDTEGFNQFEINRKPPIPPKRKGTFTKHRSGYGRTGSGAAWVEEFHNKLQQQFFEWLKASKSDPDGKTCIMEKDFVDITYTENEQTELYEVKTSPVPWKCMREAVGQLIYYSSLKPTVPVKLFVVGPGTMTEIDKQFLSYIRNNFKVPFDYISFPNQNLP